MSANRLITERNYFILLVPFFYAFFSRMRGLRAFGFNAVTLWTPGILLTSLVLDDFSGKTISNYFAGYFIFISIYELGYLMNDTLGLRHDETPRRRIAVDFSIAFYVLFFISRLLLVLAISLWIGVLSSLWFWALLGILSLAILAHNLVIRQEIKPATFFQMSLMRFSLPIFIPTAMEEGLIVLAVGSLFFVFPRFLTYMDSKNRLNIPERKQPNFLVRVYFAFFPVVLLISIASGEKLALLIWVYFTSYAGFVFAGSHWPSIKTIINKSETR